MLAGNVFAQAIGFLAALVITRLYTPGAFGIMMYIWSLTSILSIMGGLHYNLAILYPVEDEKTKSLIDLSLICICGVTIIVSLALWGFKGVFVSRAGIPGVENYLWFVPLGIFIYGIQQTLASFHTRFKHFKLLAGSQIVVSVVNALFKIIPALLVGASALWLIAGNVVGILASAMQLLWVYIKDPNKQDRLPRIDSIWGVAKEYSKFPKIFLPTNLLNSISQNLPVILFAALFTPEFVGFYGLANNILRKPLHLAGQSLNSVFLQKALETENIRGDQFNLLKRITISLALIGIVPFGLITIFGDTVFVLLFGQQWRISGVCAQILAPWLFMGFVNISANQMILAKQAFSIKFLLEFTYIILSVVGIYVGHYFFPTDFIKTLAIFSFIGFFRGVVMNYAAFALSRKVLI